MPSFSASDLAGLRIKEARRRRGWTVRDLAERCADAGAKRITAAVVTDLESRRRSTREITVDEVFVLARVLGIPPMQLIAPLGADEQLAVLPGVQMDALEAVNWIGGDSPAVLLWRAFVPEARNTEDILRRTPPADALAFVRQIRIVTQVIAERDAALDDPKLREKRPEFIPSFEFDMSVMADRLMRLAAAMEALGYEPPGLESVAEILVRRGLPSTLAEWRERGADKDPDFDVDVMWSDGEG